MTDAPPRLNDFWVIYEAACVSEAKPKWNRRKEARPAEIISAAIDVFAEKGFAAAKHDDAVTEAIARDALDMAEVDPDGLDKNDRKYLETLIDLFAGGPTGVEALAATMNLAADTLSDEIEPYLLREQYIIRSARGRVAMPRADTVLGKPAPRPKAPEGPGLFDAAAG